MAFYAQQPALGFAWLAPVVQLVGGAMQSHPVDGQQIQPITPTNPLIIAAGAIGAVGVVGGLLYLLWKA